MWGLVLTLSIPQHSLFQYTSLSWTYKNLHACEKQHIPPQTTSTAISFLLRRENLGACFHELGPVGLCVPVALPASLSSSPWPGVSPSSWQWWGELLWLYVDNLDLMGNKKQFLASLKCLKVLRKATAFLYYSHLYFGFYVLPDWSTFCPSEWQCFCFLEGCTSFFSCTSNLSAPGLGGCSSLCGVSLAKTTTTHQVKNEGRVSSLSLPRVWSRGPTRIREKINGWCWKPGIHLAQIDLIVHWDSYLNILSCGKS